jgi:hypothetical protein
VLRQFKEISMPCPRHTLKRAESGLRVDHLLVRPRDFAAAVGNWLAAAGLMTIAVLVTMLPFFLL